jgi:hypothetical protein
MVKIKNIEEPVVKLFFNGLFVGEIKSGLSFYDVLSQIKEENVYGYSIEYNSEVINIDKEGTLEKCPNGLYDQLTDILLTIV